MMCSIEELGSNRDMYPDVRRRTGSIYPARKTLWSEQSAIELSGTVRCDTVVEYEITSNRVDCFSVILGIAREAAATFRQRICSSGCDSKQEMMKKADDYIKVIREG